MPLYAKICTNPECDTAVHVLPLPKFVAESLPDTLIHITEVEAGLCETAEGRQAFVEAHKEYIPSDELPTVLRKLAVERQAAANQEAGVDTDSDSDSTDEEELPSFKKAMIVLMDRAVGLMDAQIKLTKAKTKLIKFQSDCYK